LRQFNKQLIEKYDALTQSLFLEMFGDPVRNEKGFLLKSLKEFGSSRLGKMLDGKKIIGNNLKPYLRNSNVQWFRFQLDNLLQMDFNENDKREFSLNSGDVLMCEGGEIGRCAIWKDEIGDCYFQKAIHRIRLNDKYVLPEYFVYMFKKISDNGGLDEFKSAATISHLTGEKLKKMRMPIPPINLQNQFAERVQMIETQKQQAQEALEKSEDLFQSLLQRAFKGELV
jgi:type I restriction enzyme S subunit